MENTIYFKDISNCDKNNYPNKIYRVEHSKMLIEILDDQHIQGSAQYFSSIRSRNNFIDSIKLTCILVFYTSFLTYFKKASNYFLFYDINNTIEIS